MPCRNVPAGRRAGRSAVVRSLVSTNARWLAPVVAACLVASGCQPSPTQPTTSGPAGLPAASPVGASTVAASPAARIPLADDLRDAIDPDAIVADLGRLQ